MTRSYPMTLFTAVLISGFATILPAGPIADKAAEVEAAIAEGNHAAAYAGAGAITEEAWKASPQIGFTTVALATEPSVDFGIYNPRPDNKYKAGSPIIIYTEPWGFGYGAPGEGLYSINFAVDLELLTEAGETLGSLKDIAKIDFVARSRRKEANASVIFNLDGISPGKYLLKVTMRDMNSEKTGSFDMPIEIVQ